MTTPPQPSQESALHHAIDPSSKANKVHNMFSSIAARYDMLNRLLSFGVDGRWRREACQAALAHEPKSILDLATGTADLAIQLKKLSPDSEVIGCDFVENMLAVGRQKVARAKLDLPLEQGDALNLPYEDERFDSLTIAYGLRNFADFERGLAECYRVLKPQGRLVVLEFPPPPKGLFGRLFRWYFFSVTPFIGGLLSGQREAYRYLPSSVMRFPEPERLAQMMSDAGFSTIKYRLQSLGISALHVADK